MSTQSVAHFAGWRLLYKASLPRAAINTGQPSLAMVTGSLLTMHRAQRIRGTRLVSASVERAGLGLGSLFMRAAGFAVLAGVATFSVAHAQTTAAAASEAPAGAKTASTTSQFQRHNALLAAPTATPEDFTAQLFSGYNSAFDAYTSWKNDLNNKYNLSYTLQSSYFLQSATPYGGKPVSLFVYSPSITWSPINSTTWGTGQFNVAFQQAQYWSGKVNNAAQQASIGTITTPNDWSANTYSWSQLSYTHTLPGAFNWLSLTVGQYSFG
jgi:hypothetical protein